MSITERAKLTGGSIRIETGLIQGTRVDAMIPVNGRPKTSADAVIEGQVA